MIDRLTWGSRWALVLSFLLVLLLAGMTGALASAPGEAETSGFVIGFVEGSGGLVASSDEVQAVGRYVQEQLSIPVRMRGFSDEEQLYSWLSRFREVDAAWLSNSRVENLPIGELTSLVVNQNETSTLFRGQLVVHQGVSSGQRQQLQKAFLSMAPDLLAPFQIRQFAQARGVAQTVIESGHSARNEQQPLSRRTEPVGVASQEMSQVVPAPAVTVTPVTPPVAPSIVIGFVEKKSGLDEASAPIQAVSQFIAGQLATPVRMRGFSDEDQLFNWLSRFREIDAGWLSKDRLATLPIGEVVPLVENLDSDSILFHDQLVTHQGVDAGMRQQLQAAFLAMGQDLLAQFGIRQLSLPQDHTVQAVTVIHVDPQTGPERITPLPKRSAPMGGKDSGAVLAAADKPGSVAGQSVAVVAPPISPVPAAEQPVAAPLPVVVESPAEPAALLNEPPSESPRPTPGPSAPATAAVLSPPVVAGQQSLVVGYVEETDGRTGQIEAMGRLLEERLSMPVRMRGFSSEGQLYRWLSRFREVDAAWLSSAYLKSVPIGELTTLVKSPAAGSSPLHDQLVVHQGVAANVRQRLQAAVLSLDPDLNAENGVPSYVAEARAGTQFEDDQAVPRREPAPPEPEASATPTIRPVSPAAEVAVTAQTVVAPRSPEPGAPEEPVMSTVETVDVAPVQESETPEPAAQSDVVGAGPQSLKTLFDRTDISVLAGIDSAFLESLESDPVVDETLSLKGDDADLTQSIRAGRQFNRESRAALARQEQAEAQTKEAFGLLLPNATLRLSRGREISKPSVETDEVTGELVSKSRHTRTDAAFVLRQPLFDLPSFLDWRRRKVIEKARGQNYRISDSDAYLSTVDAYLSLVSSRLQTDVTRDFETQLLELFDYIEKRTNAGASSVSDMARVDARRVATLSFRLEQESAHTTAWLDFVRLTNLAPQTVRLPVVDEVGAELLPETFDRAVQIAMKRNPEIAALKSELEAAKIDQGVAKSRYLPRLNAEYTKNYSQHAGGEPDSDGQRDERFMAVLDWELFSGGRDYYAHRESAARYKELQYRLDDQRRRVIQALSANYAALATTRERIASGYQELDAISTAADAMSQRMLSGNQSLLDLLDVYDRLFRARSRLINLHILEMNTVAQLVRLTIGTPWADAGQETIGRDAG